MTLHALGKVYLGQGLFDAADQVLQLAEERSARDPARHGSTAQLAQLRMLRLHAAAQLSGASAEGAPQAMADLLCEQVVALSAVAGMRGWRRAACRTTMRAWVRASAERANPTPITPVLTVTVTLTLILSLTVTPTRCAPPQSGLRPRATAAPSSEPSTCC